MTDFTPLVEAILFAAPDAVSVEALSGFLGRTEEEIVSALETLQREYAGPRHGFELLRHDREWRFATKKDVGPQVALFLSKRKSQLSNAALETLSIAAYNQPVTKPFISQIRGVASAEIVDSLTDKGLLREDGHLDLPGRPMSYVTTDKFLTVFGLSSLSDLPPLTDEDRAEVGENAEISLEEAAQLDEPALEPASEPL